MSVALRDCLQEWWHIKVTSAEQCVVRLTSQPAEREGGSRFKVEAFTVRPQSVESIEGRAGPGAGAATAGSEWAHEYEKAKTGRYGGAWRKGADGQ